MTCPHCDDGRDRQDRRRACPYCGGTQLVCDRCRKGVRRRLKPWTVPTLCSGCRCPEPAPYAAPAETRVYQAGVVLALLRRRCTMTWMPWDPDHYHVTYDVGDPPGEELRAVAKALKPEIIEMLRDEYMERKAMRAGRRK
jgi:hypothetical protein